MWVDIRSAAVQRYREQNPPARPRPRFDETAKEQVRRLVEKASEKQQQMAQRLAYQGQPPPGYHPVADSDLAREARTLSEFVRGPRITGAFASREPGAVYLPPGVQTEAPFPLKQWDVEMGRTLAAPLRPVTSRIPGGRYVQPFAETALRPTTLASLAPGLAPTAGLPLMARLAARAAIGAGANAGVAALQGERDPRSLLVQGAIGAGAEALLPETPGMLRLAARAGRETRPAAEAAGRWALTPRAAERGELRFPGKVPEGEGQPMFHGTATPDDLPEIPEGTFVTPDRATAESYAEVDARIREAQGLPVGQPRVVEVRPGPGDVAPPPPDAELAASRGAMVAARPLPVEPSVGPRFRQVTATEAEAIRRPAVVQGVGEQPAPRAIYPGQEAVGRELQRQAETERLTGYRTPPPKPERMGRDVVGEAIEGHAVQSDLDRITADVVRRLRTEGANVPTVERDLASLHLYQQQADAAAQAVDTARTRLKAAQAAWKAQRTRRAAVRGARARGMTAEPENLLTGNELQRLQKEVDAAKAAKATGRAALREADARVSIEDVAGRARAAGADENTVQALEQAVRNDAALAGGSNFYDAPPWQQRIVSAIARVAGNVPGVVGRVAQSRLSFENALAIQTDDFLSGWVTKLNNLLEKEAPTLKFVGPEKYRPLADRLRAYYVVTHPEDFAGISPELRQALDEVDRFQRARYLVLRAIDPKAAPEVSGRYLPQLWDWARAEVERVRRPAGRPGMTKPRTIKDWRALALREDWPEMVEMTPAELIEYGMRGVDRALGNAMERKLVLSQLGTKVRPKMGAGQVPFRNPLYAGWYADPHTVSFIDALHEPGPAWVSGVRNVAGAMKNTAFGFDFSVFLYNLAHGVAFGGPKALVGMTNRALALLHLPSVNTRIEGLTVGRTVENALDGLPARGVEAPFVKGQGTLLQYVPGIGRIDPVLAKAMDRNTSFQYGTVMNWYRQMLHEGNLVTAKFLGRDITDPAVRRASVDNALAVTGGSRGAARQGRRQIEGVSLSSPQITRSQAATLGQLLHIVRTGASAEQRLFATTMLASFGAMIYGVGSAINMALGNGPVEFNPAKGDWASIHMGGRVYPLVPQRSLIRAMGDSIEALAKADPNQVAAVWAKYGVSRASPAAQVPAGAVGFGWEPGEGFQTGTLPAKERVRSIIPTPPTVQQVWEEGEYSAPRILESVFGGGSWPESVYERKQKFLQGLDLTDLKAKAAAGDTAAMGDLKLIEEGVAPQFVEDMPEWKALEERAAQERRESRTRSDMQGYIDEKNAALQTAGEEYQQTRDGAAYRGRQSTIMQTFRDKMATMDFAEKGLLDDYFAATYDRATVNGILDNDLLDQYVADWEKQAKPEEIAAVDQMLLKSDDPVQRQLRQDRQRIEDSGYWTVEDRLWAKGGGISAAARQEYRTFREYKAAIRQKILDNAMKHVDPETAATIADTTVDRLPQIKRFEGYVAQIQEGMRRNPKLLQLLKRWGYKTSAKKDIVPLRAAALREAG